MRIAVLGPLAVEAEEGVPLVVPGAKERLLLAVLVVAAPGVVSADRLVDSLWDGLPPASARKNVQAHLVRLRSSLEPDRAKGSTGQYVVRRGLGYALTLPRSAIDALHFGDLAARGHAQLVSGDAPAAARELGDALRLWRGEPYAEWPDADFAAAERQRLTEVHRGAVTGLAEAQLALGRHAVVLPELQRHVTEEPLREDWWRLLMLALYRSGRQADALAAGRHVRSLLADELGSSPGPALRDMEQAILAQAPGLDVPAAPPWPASRAGGDRAVGFARTGRAATGSCPYKGLAPYQVADAPLFHGRRRLVSGLLGRLVDTQLVVVSGASGAGKSSVVRAGVIPALSGGAVPGSEAWGTVIVTPGPRPVDALAELTGDAPPDDPVVLVVDQFEEVWAPRIGAAERSAFFDTVLGLLDDGVVARCVVVVRGDHLGRLAEHVLFAERAGAALILVPALTETELREIVREPARSVGLEVEPALVDAVVADVVGQPAALPLLSTALVGTWERRRNDVLELAGYLEAGGVQGALTRSAEAAYSALEEDGRRMARHLLVRLADVDDGGALIRRSVSLAELDLDAEGGDARRQVVEAFVRRRLLSVEGERLEVAHEALLSAWPRLALWLEDDAAGRAVRRHLAPAAREWSERGRPDEDLYRGPRLAAALEWAAGDDADLTPLEREFLATSQDRADTELREARAQVVREQRAGRRTRRLAVGLAALLVVAVVAAGSAVRFQRAANARAAQIESNSLTADATRLAALSGGATSVDVSLLLAVQAVELARTAETEDALLGSLLRHGRAVATTDVGEGLEDTALGGNGTLFLQRRGSVFTWAVRGEPAERQQPSLVGAWTGWAAADASPTEDLLVIAGSDLPQSGVAGNMWARLVQADGHSRPLVPLEPADAEPFGVSFTGDGRRVHLFLSSPPGAGADRQTWSVTGFDVATGQRRDTWIGGTLPGATRPAVDVSDDGGTAVVYDDAGLLPPTLVNLADGRQVPLQVPRRTTAPAGFRALSDGVTALWRDGVVTLFDLSGQPVQQVTHRPGPVLDVVAAPDGTWAATVGGEGAVTLWDVDPTGSGQWVEQESFAGHDGGVVEAEVTPDGRLLVTRGADGRIVVWDVTAEAGFGTPLSGGGSDRWLAGAPVVLVPGRLVVAMTTPAGDPVDPFEPAPTDLAATFLDPGTGRIVRQVELGKVANHYFPSVASMAVSPDRRMVAISTGLSTTVLDARTFARVATVVLPPDGDRDFDGQPLAADAVGCVGWTPDSSRLLLCTETSTNDGFAGHLVVVEPTSRREDRRIPLDGISPYAIATHPGAVAVADVAGIVVLLDPHTLQMEQVVTLSLSLSELASFTHMSFSADGQKLAVLYGPHRLDVIDLRTYESAQEPIPFGRDVQQAEWLPDDRTLALAGVDGSVSLYDPERDQLRVPMLTGSTDDRALDLRVLVDGSDELVAISAAAPGRRWSLDPADWVERACAVAGRTLDRTEWAQYLPDRPYRPACGDPD